MPTTAAPGRALGARPLHRRRQAAGTLVVAARGPLDGELALDGQFAAGSLDIRPTVRSDWRIPRARPRDSTSRSATQTSARRGRRRPGAWASSCRYRRPRRARSARWRAAFPRRGRNGGGDDVRGRPHARDATAADRSRRRYRGRCRRSSVTDCACDRHPRAEPGRQRRDRGAPSTASSGSSPGLPSRSSRG